MTKINLVQDNEQFFRHLKKRAIENDIEMTTKWAKMSIIIALKYFLHIED